MSAIKWEGVYSALLTPFDADDHIDYNLFEINIQAQVDAQIDGIVLGGSLGEASTLSFEEKKSLLTHAKRIVKDRIPVVLNIAEQSTKEAMRIARQAEASGADGLMVLPPMRYNADKATSEFVVRAPSHYKVISNGLLLEESNLDAATRLTHWKQSVPIACWLYVLGVADLAVQYVGQVDGKSIQTWVYPRDRVAGFYDLATPTKSVVEFFSDYVGPYAYEKVANVQATSHGGMETASAIFYTENLINGKRTEGLRNVVIHELAHQWFGNAVTESTWDDAWLSEGFATFFTLLYIEHAYGHDAYVKGLLNAKKLVYAYYDKDPHWSIVADRTAEDGPVTNIITYQKGAWFLHMLRDSIGDEAFQTGIRSYYHDFMNSNATTGDLLQEMGKASGKNLKAFFDQWLYHSEDPELKGNWKYDAAGKKIIVTLDQLPKDNFLFDVPVEIGIYADNVPVPKVFKFRLNTKTAAFEIPADTKPERVVFDPRTVLLARVDFKRAD